MQKKVTNCTLGLTGLARGAFLALTRCALSGSILGLGLVGHRQIVAVTALVTVLASIYKPQQIKVSIELGSKLAQ